MLVLRGASRMFVAFGFIAAFASHGGSAEARPLFVCEIGAKRIEIAKESGHFVYRFGPRARTELTIVGDPLRGEIFRLSMSFDGEERQLRFVHGDVSYTAYVTSGNPAVGAKAIAGRHRQARHDDDLRRGLLAHRRRVLSRP